MAPEFTTQWPRNAHQAGQTFGRVHALGAWKVKNITIAGDASHLFRNGVRFADPSIVPPYVEELIARGEVDPRQGLDLPERIIDRPAVLFMGWGPDVYGHSLIEMATKIRIAASALGKAPERLHFVLQAQAPDWFRQVIALAGARQFIEYDHATERPLLRRGWVATLPWHVGLHPACAQLFEAMRPAAPRWTGEAIYVTRRTATVTRPIRLLNALEIEEVAQRAGLRIVCPEHMPVAEQALMFADARLVVGEYGSALANALFCRPDTVIGAIGVRSVMLSAISAVCRLHASYFDPTGNPDDPEGYTIDADRFARWLEALLAAAKPSNDC